VPMAVVFACHQIRPEWAARRSAELAMLSTGGIALESWEAGQNAEG
jgi:hypothetical protein